MQDLVSSSFKHCYQDEVRKVIGHDGLCTQELDDSGTENVERVTLVNPKFQTSLLSIQSSEAKNVSLSTPHRGSSWSYTPPFSSEAESVSAPIPYSGSSRLYTPPLSLEAKSVSASIPYTGVSRPYTPPLTLRDTSVSVSIPHRVSNRPCTPPLSYASSAVTASIDAAHQSFIGRIQS